MLTSASLELLNIMILKEKSESVLSHLLELGIFHPVDVRDIEQDMTGLTPYQIEKEHADWEALEITLRELTRKLNLTIVPGGVPENFTLERVRDIITELEQKTAPLLDEKANLSSALKVKETMLSQIKDYLPFRFKNESGYTFLEITVGRIEERSIPVLVKELEHIPHVLYPFKREENNKFLAMLIVLRRDRAVLDKSLRQVLWEKVEFPQEGTELPKNVEAKLKEEIADYNAKVAVNSARLKTIAEVYRKNLEKVMLFIALKKSLLQAKKFSYTTQNTILLSGWVPREDAARVKAEIKKIAGSTYMEEQRAEETSIPKEDIPVKLKHHVLVKPFSLLLESYGLPRYGTIDPTIFVAFSFLLMFGAMFGDLGHGLVLVLLGILLWKGKNEKVKQSGSLILYCGTSSSIFGALYGSVFGYEFHSVWPSPISNIMGMFKVSVIFGVVIISLGIVLNIINAVKDKDYVKALFDKTGLIAGIVYWLGLAMVTKSYILKKDVSFVYTIPFVLGLAALFLKPFVDYFRAPKHESVFLFFIEGIIDLLEFFMGYLANTVSFIRVAAFALAHAGLFIAIFELSKMLENVGGGTLSVLIVVLGNIFVIVLEGLVVTIQSVRLNYYEFFSKFFVAGKKEFKPLKI